jgi:hypothetical protein
VDYNSGFTGARLSHHSCGTMSTFAIVRRVAGSLLALVLECVAGCSCGAIIWRTLGIICILPLSMPQECYARWFLLLWQDGFGPSKKHTQHPCVHWPGSCPWADSGACCQAVKDAGENLCWNANSAHAVVMNTGVGAALHEWLWWGPAQVYWHIWQARPTRGPSARSAATSCTCPRPSPITGPELAAAPRSISEVFIDAKGHAAKLCRRLSRDLSREAGRGAQGLWSGMSEGVMPCSGRHIMGTVAGKDCCLLHHGPIVMIALGPGLSRAQF